MTLVIDYCGDESSHDDGDLTFGRKADLVIDDNPYLHRVAGRFVYRERLWWIQNQSKRMTFAVRDVERGSRVELAPGDQVALTLPVFEVTFRAGPTTYCLEGRLSEARPEVEPGFVALGTETVDFGVVPLTADQHLLLVALCEPRLRDGGTAQPTLPTNAEAARHLDWSLTKFNRKLDNLCLKFARQGVKGLHGSQGALASDRRAALAAHAVAVGLVSDGDLPLLRRDGDPGDDVA